MNREGTGNEGRAVKHQEKAKRKRMAAVQVHKYIIGKGLIQIFTIKEPPEHNTLNTKHRLFAKPEAQCGGRLDGMARC